MALAARPTIYHGMDVHKESVTIVVLPEGRSHGKIDEATMIVFG